MANSELLFRRLSAGNTAEPDRTADEKVPEAASKNPPKLALDP